MRDPIKDLEDFGSEGTPMTPLPPSEIRRRGDRIRRRRNAVTGVGAAAAVAVIATTGFMITGGADHAEGPGPAVTPSGNVSQSATPSTIPARFPIDDGLKGAQITQTAQMSDLEFCGDRPLRGVAAADVRSAELGGGEASFTRTLYRFESKGEARGLHEAIVTSARECPDPDPQDGTVSLWDTTLGPWPGNTIIHERGDGSTTEPTTEVVHVVTKGSAVLVTSTSGAWYDDQKAGVENTRSEVSGVIEAMDEFGAVPEGLPIPSTTTDGP